MKLIHINKNIDYLEPVMNIVFNEWGKNFSSSKESKLNKIRQAIQANEKYPQIYALTENNKVIGSFSFLDHELEGSDLSPWLACVVIDKPYRSKGYGKILLQHINKIIDKTYPIVYLTTDMTGFYEKIGFKLIKLIDNNGKNNRLYCKTTK